MTAPDKAGPEAAHRTSPTDPLDAANALLGRQPRPWGRVLIIAAAVVVMGVAAFRLMPPPTEDIPEALIGVWESDAPAYAGRPFEIEERTVLFRTGDGPYEYSIHPIRRVVSQADGPNTRYQVEYVNHGKPYEFVFTYVPGPEAAIRLEHQGDLVWKKTQAFP
jgi:hypothetical protein